MERERIPQLLRLTCGHAKCLENVQAVSFVELAAKARELGWQQLPNGQRCPAHHEPK